MNLSSYRNRAGTLARFALFGAVFALPLAAGANAQRLCFRATLDGGQEVPPNVSAGTGAAFFIMDQVNDTLTYDIQFNGLTTTETAAHIHGPAPAGANAGVQFNLGIGNPKSGVWNYPAALEADIIAGLMYVNIHSSTFPAGEIRGQILLDTSSAFLAATIDGSQEVPPNPSAGTGVGYFLVDTAADKLDYRIEFSNLSAGQTAAHIHGYAPPGANAGVQHNIGVGNSQSGTWFYPAGDEASILAGLAYVNIHSTAFPGGEIRGQMKLVCTDPSTYCIAKPGLACGLPAIGFSGASSASATSGFKIFAGPARAGRLGVLLYTNAGPANTPFPPGGHVLCVASPPLRRGGPVDSGGTPGPNCDGTFALDMNEYASGNYNPGFPTHNPAPFLLVPGTQVNCQWWGRDTPATGTFMSDGLQYFVRP